MPKGASFEMRDPAASPARSMPTWLPSCSMSVTVSLIPAGTTYCPPCARQRDAARGSRIERGYDADHTRARRAWVPVVQAGGVRCRRCREPIDPDEPWDLGHPDADCPKPRAPEHRRCNRATAGRT